MDALSGVPGTNAQSMAIGRAFSRTGEAPEAVLMSPPPFIDVLPVGVYACDAVGRICWFNRRAAELWGRSPTVGDDSERFCGSYKLFSLDGSLIRHDECPMAEVLRSSEPVEGREIVLQRPNGERAMAIVNIDPIKDRSGQIIGAVNCFQDITALKDEGRRLRDTERQFRQLLDALPAAIYTTDAAGRITYYNEAAVALSGRRPQLGSDEWCVTWRLYWPDGTPLPHEQCPMAIALKGNRPVRGTEAVAERPDGTRVPFLPYPTPLHDAFGNVVGAVNMLVDISHRKEAETQQRILFAELNHRTKNNLQMLQGLLGAALRETTNDEARAVLGDAVQRVGAMSAAQRVLYQANNPGGYAAREFLSAVCGSARHTFPKGISIQHAAAAAELSNDTAAPLALILNELITNAAKHGVNGRDGGSIEVRLDKDADQFVLRVEDDGPGFELTDTARRRSSGLGLVMGLVRQIGGTFTVKRTPGACCAVRFPDDPRVC
jgi:PAS domain S-box-containing protein